MSNDINFQVKILAEQANRTLQTLDRNLASNTKSVNALTKATQFSSTVLKTFAGNLAAIGVAKVASLVGSLASNMFGLVQSSLKVSGEMETLRTQFEVLTGSAGMANKAVQDLQQFAANTPFQFAELAQAQQRLLSFGFTLEESAKHMETLGDVAAASGAPFGDLALIFGQVNAAGKLTGERLLQLQERAIPIGPALAETMGVAESSIRDLVSKGQVDFATFEKAFSRLNDSGQFAFNGMIKRSQTLEGRISTLKDNFQLLQASIGQQLAPALKAAVTTITLFIQRLQESAGFKQFLQFIGNSIPQAIQFAIDSFSFIINTIMNVVKVFNLFRSGVASALEFVMRALSKFAEVYAKVLSILGLGDTTLAAAATNVSKFQNEIANSLGEVSNTFAQKAAEIGLSQEKINSAIEAGGKFVLDTYAQEVEAAKAQNEALAEQATVKKEIIQELSAAEQAELEKLNQAKQALALVEAQSNILALENQRIFQDERLLQLQDYFTREQQAEIQARINAAANQTERERIITEAQATGIKNRIDAKVKEAEALKKIEEQESRTRLQQRNRFLNEASSLAATGSKELVAIGKAAALTQIAIDTQEAISGAYAYGNFIGGPPVGVAFAAVAGAAQAVRAQQVLAVSPRFQDGGIVPGSSVSGDRVIARVNSGEMILNQQQQARLFQMANSGGGSGQEIVVNTTVELDGEVVGRSVSRQVANGLRLGEVQ